MKAFILFLIATEITSMSLYGQTLSSQSNQFQVDGTTIKKVDDSWYASIVWTEPSYETSFTKEQNSTIRFEIQSKTSIKSVTLAIYKKETPENRNQVQIPVGTGEQNQKIVEKTIYLDKGINIVEVVVENTDGLITKSDRTFHVGETVVADASTMDRTDYAVLFGSDNYDNWGHLQNPVFDAETIASELEKNYGFKVEVVENATQEQIWLKISELARRKYKPLDQLFIFFAGHGLFDDVLKEGFLVSKESLRDDPGHTSCLSYNRLRSTVNNIPCDHIFLVMDACFGGTFDEKIADNTRGDGMYTEVSQSELIGRKLTNRTRFYLTSGGKEYVPDGTPGSHSPFAAKFLEALDSKGGNDGVLTVAELQTYMEKLVTEPQFGTFGSNQEGSDFLFIVK